MIPETLKQVDVFKGPYWVEYGDFSTAAAINFITRDGVTEDIVQAAGGNWGTQSSTSTGVRRSSTTPRDFGGSLRRA
jgi:outer membrane receptor protein involved in Fe transport